MTVSRKGFWHGRSKANGQRSPSESPGSSFLTSWSITCAHFLRPLVTEPLPHVTSYFTCREYRNEWRRILVFKSWYSGGAGFPGGSEVKPPPACAGDVGSTPGPGRPPGGGNGSPLQYPYWANPMDRGAWQAIVHQVTKKLDTTYGLNNSSILGVWWDRKYPQVTPSGGWKCFGKCCWVSLTNA